MKNQKQQKILEEALMAFRHRMTCALVDEAKKHDWSLSHFEVIKYIAEQGDPSMKDIASQLHITPPSASTLVDTLVSKNLVVRIQKPSDRRSIHLALTPTAQRILSAIYKKKSSIFNTMLSNLGAEDMKEFTRILNKCANINKK